MQHISPYAVRIKSRHVGFGQELISVDKKGTLLLLHNTKRHRLNQVLFERLISEANDTESSLVFYADLMFTHFFFLLSENISIGPLEACLMSHYAAN